MRILCPAKVNLFLSVTGARPDGFHDLVSVVCPLELADILEVELLPEGREWAWSCNVPELPQGRDNLVGKAAELYLKRTGRREGLSIRLEKRIPSEAGLGGGSSDAAGMLLALQALCGNPLSEDALGELAAHVGSDCPLFLRREALIMRGRGDLIESLPRSVLDALDGMEVSIFKPQFGVSTGWAYQALRDQSAYLDQADSEAAVSAWLRGKKGLQGLLYNSFERVIRKKYLAMDALLQQVFEDFGYPCLMSGSGSACFALTSPNANEQEVFRQFVKDAWGADAFCQHTRLAAISDS